MTSADSIETAFEACLSALLEQGPQAAFDLLRGHRREPELRRLLEAASLSLRALDDAPSAAARSRHLRALTEAARPRVEARVAPSPRRTGRRRRLVLRPAAVLAALLLAGVPATAALASGALPGQPLYGTKLAIENARLALEQDPEGDVALHLEFAGRRLQELSKVAGKADARGLSRALRNLAEHLSRAGSGLGALHGRGEAPTSLEHLDQVRSHHVEVLTDLIEDAECAASDPSAGDPRCKGLLTALENSTKNLDRPGVPGRGPPSEAPPAPPGEGTPPSEPPGKP